MVAGQRVEADDPVIVGVHLTAPTISYLDRKPNAVRVPADLAKRVRAYLARHPEGSRDVVIATIAGWTNIQE